MSIIPNVKSKDLTPIAMEFIDSGKDTFTITLSTKELVNGR